jgi:hypothetical protein
LLTTVLFSSCALLSIVVCGFFLNCKGIYIYTYLVAI